MLIFVIWSIICLYYVLILYVVKCYSSTLGNALVTHGNCTEKLNIKKEIIYLMYTCKQVKRLACEYY